MSAHSMFFSYSHILTTFNFTINAFDCYIIVSYTERQQIQTQTEQNINESFFLLVVNISSTAISCASSKNARNLSRRGKARQRNAIALINENWFATKQSELLFVKH